MKVLVVGLGSIAQKHIKVLRDIHSNVEIFSLRSQRNSKLFNDVINKYTWEEVPYDLDFIIISNPTSEHFETLKSAIKFKVPLFIEKPPLSQLNNSNRILDLINKNKITTYVAYNLRFHPVIKWLKKNLQLYKIREVNIYCGSYLPEWRKGIDYRYCYSAIKELGGGVHLDLIHELDYSRWLFGEPVNIRAVRSKKSNLEINSYDYANYLLEYNNFFTNVTLNYYRRDSKRNIELVMDNETWIADLINYKIVTSNDNVIFHVENYDPLQTYYEQMEYFIENVIKDNNSMNNFEESLKTLSLCLS